MKFVAFQDVMIQLNISLHVGDTVVYLKLKQNNMYLMAVNVCDISSSLYLSRIKLRTVCTCSVKLYRLQGRIQDFKLGGAHLKKVRRAEGGRENFWGISCEKSRFYAKKLYFFQLRREARKFLGYFV
jgi:hypothetical protein